MKALYKPAAAPGFEMVDLPEPARSTMLAYFANAADFLVNS